MAKSSLAIGPAAVLFLLGSAASAGPVATAEEALARQQASVRAGLECERGEGEIVVCGRSGPDPHRLPLPVAPEPGARSAGEPPDAVEALALSKQRCTTVGPNQQCSGGLPILPIAIWAVETAIELAKGDD